MKSTWSYSYGGGEGCVKFAVTKKRLARCEDINKIIASDVSKALKINKKSKDKAKYYTNLENESKPFNVENSILERIPTWNEKTNIRSG